MEGRNVLMLIRPSVRYRMKKKQSIRDKEEGKLIEIIREIRRKREHKRV